MPSIALTALKATLTDGKKAPHLSELAQHFTQLVGGPRAVAKLLHTEFMAAPSGGVVRSRILEIIFRATKIANDREGATDIGTISDDELGQQLDQLLEEAAHEHPGA